MGCSNPKEKLEDQINLIKLKRFTIQMEREKALKLLSEMDGRNLDADYLAEYLASKNVKQFKNMDMKYNEENNEIHKEQKKDKDNKAQSLIPNSKDEHGLNDNQNINNNILSNNNDKHNYNVNQNTNKPLNVYLNNNKENDKKKKIDLIDY